MLESAIVAIIPGAIAGALSYLGRRRNPNFHLFVWVGVFPALLILGPYLVMVVSYQLLGIPLLD
jgi:hypothetical protein